jgi:hypothetical protein
MRFIKDPTSDVVRILVMGVARVKLSSLCRRISHIQRKRILVIPTGGGSAFLHTHPDGAETVVVKVPGRPIESGPQYER